jgi:hypothetical protein
VLVLVVVTADGVRDPACGHFLRGSADERIMWAPPGTAHRGRERREVMDAAERSDEPQTREPFRAVEHVSLARGSGRVLQGAEGVPAKTPDPVRRRTPPAPGTDGQVHRECCPTRCVARGAGQSGRSGRITGVHKTCQAFVRESEEATAANLLPRRRCRRSCRGAAAWWLRRGAAQASLRPRGSLCRSGALPTGGARRTAVDAEVRIDDGQRRDLGAVLCELVEDGALIEVARTEGPLSAVGCNGHDELRSANGHLRRSSPRARLTPTTPLDGAPYE